MPAYLKQDLQTNEAELKSQADLLDKKKKEADTINAKYDEDLRRFREVAKGGGAAPVAATAKK